jgi:5'(3')-deoxyribonucleotidase
MLKPADRPTLTKSEFWDSITRDIWATIPQSEEFYLLLGYCENLVGQENICILTAPTIDPECVAGKLEFIHNHFPKWMHRQFLIGPRKQFCAHPEALLIDDADKNVDQFRAWGGNAILVPRPWNSLHARNTVAHIHREFEHFSSLRESYV